MGASLASGRLERLARLKSQPGGVSPSLATFYEVRLR